MTLKYTEHAFARMTERDISRATVEAVVMAGAVEMERCGVCRYTLEGFSIDRMHDLKDIREALANQAVVRAVSAILIEHQRAVRKWPEWPTDTTHAAAILAGEGGECLKAANHHREGRLTEGKDSLFMVGVEATQAGAMAVRLLSNHPRKVEQ